MKRKCNSLMAIHPYRDGGLWVFDDEAKGLVKEPFVSGMDIILDKMAGKRRRLDAVFSAKPFPGHTFHLEWRRGETGGNWYYCPQLDMEGWLCPALLKYFKTPPKKIFVQLT